MSNSNKSFLGAIIFIGLFSPMISAQVAAPDFNCIFSDTLFWDNTNNACGPYQSTDIYISNTASGPFSLLISLTDQTQNSYFHPNTMAVDRYYFLQHNYDCPGEILESSDTLSNLPLENADIKFVTVDNGNVLVEWDLSGSAQVSQYIIYRVTNSGNIPIDTVSAATTSYLDTGASPGQIATGYFVVAIDPCENTSNFFNQNKTMLLSGLAGICDEAISLSWTKYAGWDNIETQEIYLSLAGTPVTKVADLNGIDSTYELLNIVSGQQYCIYIEARESGTGFVSRSNTFCITPAIVDPVDLLKLTNLSVRMDNQIEVSWYWETDIRIDSIVYENGLSPNNLTSNFSSLPGPVLLNENTRVDPNSDGTLGRTYYQLKTIDPCGRSFVSDIGSTIFLSGEAGENIANNLNWTSLDIDGAQLLNYRLFRSFGNISEELSLDDPLGENYIDFPDPNDPTQAQICYYVIADFDLILPDGTMQTFEASSNKICVQQTTKILVPNAFAPSGVNSKFKPLISFDQDIQFAMCIFDRWGQKIFETDDYLNGWDGRVGFREMSMGGYIYTIQVIQADGTVVKKEGPFVLIR